MKKALTKLSYVFALAVCASITSIPAKASSVPVNYTYKQTGNFRIKLTDAETNKGIVGAEFLVRKINDDSVQRVVITTETEDASTMLPYGQYELSFYEKPKGYNIPNNTYCFTINEKNRDIMYSILLFKK